MTQDENLRDSVDSTEAAVSRAEEARRRKASHARSGEAEVPPTRRAGFHPLAREVSYDFPLLSSLMPLSDEEIMTALTDAGYTLYERTPVGTDPDGGFEVIKLPADVSLEEAGLMYVQGIDKLSAGDAVKLLKGAWTLTVSRKAGDDMRLRYADFASGTIEKAVQGAMQVEGLENAEVTDSGVDDSGNTYQAGVVSTDNGTYNWRVSVIELDEVYDISGLPNTAFYVGIRFTAQA